MSVAQSPGGPQKRSTPDLHLNNRRPRTEVWQGKARSAPPQTPSSISRQQDRTTHDRAHTPPWRTAQERPKCRVSRDNIHKGCQNTAPRAGRKRDGETRRPSHARPPGGPQATRTTERRRPQWPATKRDPQHPPSKDNIYPLIRGMRPSVPTNEERERAIGRQLPQPRRKPSPASHPSPTDPALRVNPYPEVTDLIC